MSDVATYVLVHGGGHGGWCYQHVARRLRALGHEVHTPTLTGLAERSHFVHPGIDLDCHITDIVNLLTWEDLTDVILVGHSYGGMVVTGVADRATERIGKLVYLDAANPKNGQSLDDLAGGHMELARASAAYVNGVELVLMPGPGAAAFYGITDPAAQAWAEARFTGHPWACFEQKLVLHNEDALWALPQFHIICSETAPTRDRAMIGSARDEDRLWEIDTGHDLMITEPELVARALVGVAEWRASRGRH